MLLEEYNNTLLSLADDAEQTVISMQTFIRDNSHSPEIGGGNLALLKELGQIRQRLADIEDYLSVNEED